MTDQPNDEPEKKILIDEDWKSQVEAEKEELERKRQRGEEPESADRAKDEAPLPPASLEMLVGSLGVQAMVAMGLAPDPVSGKPQADLDQAKHLIDTIAVLQEKTEGNRTPQETAMMDNLLHELRLGYVAVGRKQAGG